MCFQNRFKQGPFYEKDWHEKLSFGGEAMLKIDLKANYLQSRDYSHACSPFLLHVIMTKAHG